MHRISHRARPRFQACRRARHEVQCEVACGDDQPAGKQHDALRGVHHPRKLSEIKQAGHQRAEALLQSRIDAFASNNPEMEVQRVLASVQALEGDPAARILDTAKQVLADIIVMGSRGHSAIGELLIGSVGTRS